jgi:hypothetical protein
MTQPEEPPASETPASEVRATPTTRAAVVIPTALFFVFDTIFLMILGATIVPALLLAAATSAVCGWWLYRRHLAAVTAEHRRAQHKPPAGSWSNPSKSQRWMEKVTDSERWRRSRMGRRRN